MVEVQIGEGEVRTYAFEEFEERVADGRIPASARIRFEPVTGDEFRLASELDLFLSVRETSTILWQSRFRNSGPPILTALLVGVQIRIWLWAQVPDVGPILVRGGVNWLSPAFENGEPWRLITYGLLHTDFLHILLNMVWMTYTGWNIERALGRANLAAIFFLSVVMGGLLSMFFTPNVPSLGASGGVYGLVSASVIFGFIRQDLLPEKGRRLFGAALAPYLVLMFLSGLSNAGTDNWAHFGGLMMGAVLALMLDPPGFERRAHQNRLVHLVGAVVVAAMLAVVGGFGPQLYPLVDKEQARLDALPSLSRARALQSTGVLLTELSWSVPAGWKVGSNAAGDSAFVSPVRGQDRSITVIQSETIQPVTIDEVFDEWKEKVLRGHKDAVFTEEEHGDWLGRSASEVRQVRVALPNGLILEWKGTFRGVYSLIRVREFEAKMEARMAPLFARIEPTIDWKEPLELQTARRNILAIPHGVKSRTEMGTALAKWGEAEEALSLFRELTEERSNDPVRWQRWLRIAGWFPERSSAEALMERALVEIPEEIVLVEVADLLRRSERITAANGLLQLAWVKSPGDRKLKRALRKAALRWALSPTGKPTQLLWLPDGTERSAEEIREVEDAVLTLDAATRWGQKMAIERAVIASTFAVAYAEGKGIDLLLRVRDGGFEPVFEQQRLLRRELLAASNGRTPRWIGPHLQEELTPSIIEALRAELAP